MRAVNADLGVGVVGNAGAGVLCIGVVRVPCLCLEHDFVFMNYPALTRSWAM